MSATTDTHSAAAWYRRNYPDGPDYDPRCLDVLASWLPLYNICRYGQNTRIDGGFRPCGDGVEVHIREGMGDLSTYDGDELTRLVIAAHKYCCRVSISTKARHMVIRVHPRDPEGARLHQRHPRLADLQKRAGA